MCSAVLVVWGTLRNDYPDVSGVPLLECAALGFLFAYLVEMDIISHRCDKNLSKHCVMDFLVVVYAQI